MEQMTITAKIQIILVTKYRNQLLKDSIADDAKQEILHITVMK